jgi:hypothetical protein
MAEREGFRGAEVQPLFPGKVERVLDERNPLVNVTDATFDGLYKYSANAITAKCGTVTLQLFSEREPDHAKEKDLDQKTINAVVSDFAPYISLHERSH